jgi:hypothetical protein
MIDGTRQLISLGYSDFGRDFLPFITQLMEESQMKNFILMSVARKTPESQEK